MLGYTCYTVFGYGILKPSGDHYHRANLEDTGFHLVNYEGEAVSTAARVAEGPHLRSLYPFTTAARQRRAGPAPLEGVPVTTCLLPLICIACLALRATECAQGVMQCRWHKASRSPGVDGNSLVSVYFINTGCTYAHSFASSSMTLPWQAIRRAALSTAGIQEDSRPHSE